MLGNEFGHLEHADFRLAAENRFEQSVGVDHPSIYVILKPVFLDVVPELLGDLRSRKRPVAYYCLEGGTAGHRFHKCRIGLTLGFFLGYLLLSRFFLGGFFLGGFLFGYFPLGGFLLGFFLGRLLFCRHTALLHSGFSLFFLTLFKINLSFSSAPLNDI